MRFGWFVGFVSCLMLVGCTGSAESAREVMSFETYQTVRHGEPYVYEITGETGALLYFGARHAFDPADAQLPTLAQAWAEFDPDLAFTEGGDLDMEGLDREAAVRRYGEFGLTRWLARQDEVSVRDLDPERAVEVAHLLEEGWTGEQIMLFYALRQVAQSGRRGEEVDLEAVLPRYLNSLADRFGLKGPTTLEAFEAAVARLLPDLEDWRTVPESCVYPGRQEPSYFTNEISTDANRFRDRYHVEQLKAAVRSGNRVFVVAGSAHAVMQQPSLSGLEPGRYIASLISWCMKAGVILNHDQDDTPWARCTTKSKSG